jgi:hypothetical protein
MIKNRAKKNSLPWLNDKKFKLMKERDLALKRSIKTKLKHDQYIHIYKYQYTTLKGTYYENSTFLGIWGGVVGIWCSHTHTNFEKSLYLIF